MFHLFLFTVFLIICYSIGFKLAGKIMLGGVLVIMVLGIGTIIYSDTYPTQVEQKEVIIDFTPDPWMPSTAVLDE